MRETGNWKAETGTGTQWRWPKGKPECGIRWHRQTAGCRLDAAFSFSAKASRPPKPKRCQATALQDAFTPRYALLECGGLTPLWISTARKAARPPGSV